MGFNLNIPAKSFVVNNFSIFWPTLNRTLDARENRNEAPIALQSLLPKRRADDITVAEGTRDVVFILGSRPQDDDFILWLGPKFEARGYSVFSDILTLQPGHRWRKEVSRALEVRAAKVVVVASEVTSRDDQVMDMVDKAIGVAKTVADPKFIIPLRMEDSVRIDGL